MPESILDLLFDPAKKQRPRRLFVYGPDKIGKSTFAAGAPSPVFIPTEDGTRHLSGIKQFPVAKTLDEFKDYVTAIAEGNTPFKTLVIDSVTGLERLVHQKVCKSEEKQSLAETPFRRGFSMAAAIFQKCLNHLEEAHINCGMNLILLGHVKVEKYSPPDGDGYDRFVPKLEKDTSAALCEWVDEYFFATRRVFTKKDGEGKYAKRKAVSSGDRVLKTTGDAAWLAGRRINLPDEIPLLWSEYEKYVNGAVVEDEATEEGD